jgi:hypothetical protein
VAINIASVLAELMLKIFFVFLDTEGRFSLFLADERVLAIC